jgi:hypothetical protein
MITYFKTYSWSWTVHNCADVVSSVTCKLPLTWLDSSPTTSLGSLNLEGRAGNLYSGSLASRLYCERGLNLYPYHQKNLSPWISSPMSIENYARHKKWWLRWQRLKITTLKFAVTFKQLNIIYLTIEKCSWWVKNVATLQSETKPYSLVCTPNFSFLVKCSNSLLLSV